MVNERGNEVAAVTQPEQNPALGEGGNEAGEGPNAVALASVQLPLPCQLREQQFMLLPTTHDSSQQHREKLQRH